MANAIKTVLTYPLDGSNRDFNIPFEYLARKFVVVTLIGVDRKVLTINTDYRFATRTTISLTKAWGPADGYTTIELRRVTSTTDRLVDFTDGSILRAYDLNVAQIQTMHVAEEARDLTADTIGVNNDGHLDARGRRIVNLANAVDDRDAVPFGQLKTMNQNSWQARNEALQFRNEAEGFRNQAATSQHAAAASESQSWNHAERSRTFAEAAQGSANSAGQSATNANNAMQSAGQSATDASNSAAQAKTSETNAKTSEINAKRDADVALNALHSSGSVPVGTVAMITHSRIPAGWIRCGEQFDVNTYPALARLFPNGVTPGFDDRFPMGNSQISPTAGAHGDQTLPHHSHQFSVTVNGATAAGGAYEGYTDAGGAHGHDVGNFPSYEWKTAPANGGYMMGINTRTVRTSDAPPHQHLFHIPDHAHGVTASGSGVTDTFGIGNSPYMRPYHTVVIFIIKAAEGVAEADTAMQVVGTVVGRVDSLEAWTNSFKPYSKNLMPVSTSGGPWDGVRYRTATDIGYNQMAVLSGSSFEELVGLLRNQGQLVGSPRVITLDLFMYFPDTSPTIIGGSIWNPHISTRVTMYNGTNSTDDTPQPVSSAAHAYNGWVPRVSVRHAPASQGGSPMVVFGFFNSNNTGVVRNNGEVNVDVRLVHYWHD